MNIELPNNKPWKQWVILSGLLLLFGYAAIMLTGKNMKSISPADIKTQTVQSGALDIYTTAYGEFISAKEQLLTAPALGKVIKILARPGAIVTPDTVILQLANPELEQQVSDAKGQLAQEKAQREAYKFEQQSARLDYQGNIANIKAEIEKAQLELTVNQDLLSLGVASKIELKRAKLAVKQQHPDNLLLALQKEINGLAKNHSNQSQQQQSIERLLNHILDSWPVPVCLFNHNMKLRYRNNAMNEHLLQPMLINTPANELGFSLMKNKLVHSRFNDKWQCQSFNFLKGKHENWLFSAINISQLLNYNQTVTQQNLIRVLGHELRNSLTPMASMTDTLLSNQHFEPKQVKIVLERIKKRSNRLLSFIGEYSQLTQLPRPKCQWFQFHDLYNEARTIQHSNNAIFKFIGSEQCFGDSEQVTQMLVNYPATSLRSDHGASTA